MKSNYLLSLLTLSNLFLMTPTDFARAGVEDLLNQATNTLMDQEKPGQQKPGQGGSVGHSDVVQGLKEALSIGTGNAVGVLSKTDGYFKNPSVKILLPESIQRVEPLLAAAGFGQQVTDFELSMNRAAERAVPEAKTIFVDAVKQMSFQDAEKILRGRENEATLFFKEKSSGRLRELFKPIAHDAMAEVGVTRQFQGINQQLGMIPMAGQLNLDLDGYVTEKALDGLFLMIAAEEKKIRQNPAARVTDILKKVFK